MENRDVLIIGAGAAGLMCAMSAGTRGRSVLVLDHADKTGKKVRVSGGGRCNFTNLNATPENYLSLNPHFCKSALARFTPHDFIRMVERHGIAYYEKEEGQLFCRRSSGEIINMLTDECEKAGAEVRLELRIGEVRKEEGLFYVSTDYGDFAAESLVIATGGLSYPELGASDFGLRVAKKFGLGVTPLKPGLVPLLFGEPEIALFRELSGISFDAALSCGKRRFRGPLLFTHRGLSGPPVLQISSYWKDGESIIIDLLPGGDAYGLLMAKRTGRAEIQTVLSGIFPERFARVWSAQFLGPRPVRQFNEKELKAAAGSIHAWEVRPVGTEGYRKAEVTVGGIDTGELSSRTMEAKKAPGLYFIGEVVDVTGQLGGFNLQWAWASGHAAGQNV
jgi:hypothetical protein